MTSDRRTKSAVGGRRVSHGEGLDGFDDNGGIMAFVIADHHLTGGWTTEGTSAGRPHTG